MRSGSACIRYFHGGTAEGQSAIQNFRIEILRSVLVDVDLRGSVHRGKPVGRYPRPAVEAVREITRDQEERQPDDIDDVVRNDRKAELLFRRAEHFQLPASAP